MISKLGAVGILGPLGWLVAALLGIALLVLARSKRVDRAGAGREPGKNEPGEDMYAGLRERYARGEVGPDEYTEELLSVPGAMGIYDVFKKEDGKAEA